MIITGFLQCRNEIDTGHLQRFLTWNKDLFDHLAVIDDGSDDGTSEFLEKHCDILIKKESSTFTSERLLKKELLREVQTALPETDWILWLDADEILLSTREELESIIERAIALESDSVSFPLLNLWRSDKYFRVDNGYDSLRKIHLWKNSQKITYEAISGLHLPSHPNGLHRTLDCDSIHVIHFGFASEKHILEKFNNYKFLGQEGDNLWRLIDEKGILLRAVSERRTSLGKRYPIFERSTQSQVCEDNLIETRDLSQNFFLARSLSEVPKVSTKPPIVTLICLIYSGVDWLEFQYSELLRLRNEFPPGLVELLFVTNDASVTVLEFLMKNRIPFIKAPGAKSVDEWYINSVYRAYNYGVKAANGKYVFLTNSDMCYSPGLLARMLTRASSDRIVVGKLIESGRLTPAKSAIKRNLGKSLGKFKRQKFYKLARRYQSETESFGGLFMPCLIEKSRFIDIGGYPEGNISKTTIQDYVDGKPFKLAERLDPQVSGDTAFFLRARDFGLKHVTANDCLTYHFQEGEKSNISTSSRTKIPTGVVPDNSLKESFFWGETVNTISNSYANKEFASPDARVTISEEFFDPMFQENPSLFLNVNKTGKNVRYQIGCTFDGNEGNFSRFDFILPVLPSSYKEIGETHSKSRHQIWNVLVFCNLEILDDVNLVKALGENRPENLAVHFVNVSNRKISLKFLGNEMASTQIHDFVSLEETFPLFQESNLVILGSIANFRLPLLLASINCERPVITESFGVLENLPGIDKAKLGVKKALSDVSILELSTILSLSGTFAPREVARKYKLDAESLEREAHALLARYIEKSFSLEEPHNHFARVKSLLPRKIKNSLKRHKRVSF